jgi:hypothetical protein
MAHDPSMHGRMPDVSINVFDNCSGNINMKLDEHGKGQVNLHERQAPALLRA